jgi:glyoxylate/hydroxypyruvate reductase A
MVLVYASRLDPKPWLEAFGRLMPELEVRVWPEIGNPDEVEVLLAWRPPDDAFQRLTKLRFLQVFGMGADQLLRSIPIPPDLPIARLVDPDQTQGMREWVLYHVLRFHRRFHLYDRQQRAAEWVRLPHTDAQQRRIGIMGLGALGSDAARTLAQLNFEVAGWSRSPKEIPGVAAFHGADGLAAFLARTEILVCLLPLTDQTEGILNRDLFHRLPRGACVINAGRGGHCVIEDLLAALDSGQLEAAALDVFPTEPLPADSPIWRHPGITATPHVATIATARSAAGQVVENIRRARAGAALLNLIDRNAGY